jgi:hypothetical protein
MNLAEIRSKYPAYKDVDDQTLVEGIQRTYYPDRSFDEVAKAVGYEPQGDFTRGAEVALGQTAPLAKGVVGLIGATAEKAVGEGGIATSVKNWGLQGYQEGMQKLAPKQRETDELTTAWSRAKQGDIGALIDWAQYGLGYMVGQGGEAVATSVLGGLAGAAMAPEAAPVSAGAGAVTGLVAKGAVKEAATSLVEKAVAKEAMRLVEETAAKSGVKITAEQAAEQAASQAVRQAATKNVAKEIGSTAALGVYGTGQELGSIYPEAERQAAEQGKQLDGWDLARVWGTGLAAGGLEALTDKLGIDVAMGKKNPFGKGIGGSTAVGLAGGAVAEGATEAAQTALERAGAGQSLTSDEAVKDYINSAGLGAIGGAGFGGATGLVRGALNSRQRDEDLKAQQAQQQLGGASDVATAIAAAQQLSGDLDTLEAGVNDYLGAGGQIPTPQSVVNAQQSSQPTIPELRGMADRNAAAIGEANAAGFAADRDNALAQAQAALPEPKPLTRDQYVDLAPMTQQQAEARLAVLRDMTAREGGNSLELAVVPHPGGNPERFAIGKQALPSLEMGTTPEPISQEAAQHRIETAALTGKVAQAKAEDQNSRQVVIDRALRNVEERGGVASPAEAKIFQEAGLGKPYDRIDSNLAPALSTDQQLTQATGIALDARPREQGSESQRLAKLEADNRESMAEQEARSQANQQQAERETQAQIDEANKPNPAPAINDVIQALVVPGANRTAEQNLTIRQAEQRMDPADFSIAQRAATAPFQLSQEERMRLRDMRATPSVAPQQSVVNTQQTGENTDLMGERVRAALGQPTGGNIITTGAKLSTSREGTLTVNDNGDSHDVKLADISVLGQTGRLVQQVARIFGKKVQAFSSDTLKADGFVQPDDNRTIYLNSNSTVSPLAVFGHELLHLLKRDNPVAYRALATVVARSMGKEGRAGFRDYYGKGADIEELTADLMGNRFQDPAFWTEVFKEIGLQAPEQATGIINRLAAALNKAVGSFLKVIQQGGFKSDEFVSDIEAVKAAVKTAVAEYAKQQKIPAMQMEAEQARATSQINMNAGSAQQAQPITASKRRADFTNPEERQEVSTTRPKPAPKKGRLSNSYDEKWVIDSQDIKGSETHVAAVLRAIGEYNTLTGKGDAATRLQELHDVVVDNLLWLHDLVPKDVRERAKLWYDGANRIATDWTSKYGISVRQSSGVLAVLSPQMDWFKNVSLGERVISIYKERQNEEWSPAMTAWFESWVNAAKDVDTKRSRQAYLDQVRPLQGVKLSEMDDRQAAFFVRAFDETYYERQYRLVTPEGGFGEYVTNSDDGDAAVTWGGFDSIEKAVSILNDGSFRNIDEKLGDEHKVRNFYNNIINPGSADGHVTIDTHAVAAALVKALSGSSMEVSHNFGSTAKGAPGAGGNVETGASGTYGLFADAYRDAAAKRELLPREMQSITWEAVRALFPASIKDQLAPKVDAIWNRFKKGELTREQARDEVRELAGGVRKMAWEGSDEGKFPAAGGTSFNTKIEAEVDKRAARTLPPEEAKDKISVSLSPNTSSIPGVSALQEAAAKGDDMAHQLLQDIALDNLKHLLDGTSARIKADGATGLYGGYVETSLSMTVSFSDNDRAQVLAGLAKFAENFNQEQIHVRRGTKAKAGTAFADGSYATPVYRWDLKEALTRKQIEKVIEKSGLYGLTFGDDFVEAYYVGDPTDEQAIEQFYTNATTADGLLGKAGGQVSRSVAQLWPYGQGDGTIGYDRIRGDVSAGPATTSETARRVAQYLNGGAKVKTFEQAAEITPEQDQLQTKIAQVYESLPDNDLKNPNVRKAYNELAKEVLRQFKALPIKVEVMNGQGEPYPNSAAMRRDILDNNHLYIFGTTPETFGPAGEDFTGHPLLEKTGLKDQNGYELLYNDLLRAVHDYYAHAMAPTQFGAKGEEAAWKNHMSMTSNPWARWALTAETRGQNSWVNFRPDLDRSTPSADRPFARQKAVLLPVEYSLTGDRTVDKPMKDFIAKLGERVKQGTKPVKAEAKLSRTRNEQAENDYLKVREKYLGTPEWMKAPNGEPTNLTERQWVQVRTPQFKEWFGDWEKHARAENPVGSLWSDENVSKAVDANGEPLVLYHGTDNGGFSIFKEAGGQKRGDLGIWMTPNRAMAQTYVKRGRGSEIQFADMDEAPIQGGDDSGYYVSFANIRNPYETDFEGAYWNGERPQQFSVIKDENIEYTDAGKGYFDDEAEAQEFADKIGGEVVSAFEHFETTDSAVREARSMGNDGTIIRNVVDDGGGWSAYAGEPSDVFVAFHPSQVKSATQNTGEFAADSNDMRFSRNRTIEFSKDYYGAEFEGTTKQTRNPIVDTPAFKRWFKNSAIVDANGDPRVVYHTGAFDADEIVSGRELARRAGARYPMGNEGIYFTASPSYSSQYGRNKEGATMYPVYVSMQNPFIIGDEKELTRLEKLKRILFRKKEIRNETSAGSRLDSMYVTPQYMAMLKAEGYDGIVNEPYNEIVAFSPNQAKSAIGNNGEFNPDDSRITKSRQRIVGDSKRAYTPAQKAMFERVGRTVEVPTIKERIAELRKDFGKKLAQGIADQFAPLKDLSKQAYTLARLSKGTPGAVEAFLHHGKLKLTDNVYDADQSGGFIERVGVPLAGELEDFLWWVASNRAERLAAEDRENLFTPEDIAAGKSLDNGTTDYDYTLQHGPNAGKTTRDRTLIYRDALKTFEEFNKNAMDMAEQSGLIDPESRKYWENQFYVPFYRVSEEDGGFIGAKIGKSLVRQRAFKQLKGGTDKLNSDLLANTLQNWAHLIDAAAKNRAAKASLEAAQNVGVAVEADQETVRSMGKAMGMRKNVVWFMDNGTERYFLVEDPYVMDAISALEYSGMKGPIMDGLSAFKHWLTIGVTASPVFKIRNLVRDSLQAVATAPLSYNIAGNIAEGIRASDRSSQTYVSALASGGLIRFGTMLENRASDRVRQLIKSGVKDSTILDSESKVQQFYDKVLEPAITAYNELGNRGEEINRSALYSQLRKQGMDHAEASLMARDLMDFSMQGTWTSIRFLTQVVPFMNARIQGLYKLGRATKEDKARMAMVIGATALASISLMAAYSDDDDWKKREDWDRNNNWWFKIGGIAYRIPKPFEIGAIATLAERGIEYFTDKEMDGKRLAKNVKMILADNLSMNPIPQATKPIMDIYANKDSFTGRPIETMGMERLEPQYRYTANTSMVARGLSTATMGALSPVQYDHLIRGYFSWLGSFVVGGADMALRPLAGEASRPTADYWKLASGGIASELPSGSSRYVSHMYEQAVELEEAMGTYKALLKEGKKAEAADYLNEHRDEIKKYRNVEHVKKAETRYNERIRMIERSAMDPDQKKAEIQKIQQLKDKVARLVY